MLKSNSIKTKYILTGLFICLISITLVSVFSYAVSYRITSDLSDRLIKEFAERKSLEFNYWFEKKEMLIESMTQDIEASGDFSNEHLAKLIKSKTRHYSRDMLDIYAGFEEDGRQLISGVGWVPPADYKAKARQWYQSAIKTGAVIFTEPYVDAMTGELIITIAKSVKNNGVLIGVIATDIYITELIKTVNSFKITENSHAMLLDETGRIIAHPVRDFLPGKNGLKKIEDIGWTDYRKLVATLFSSASDQRIALRDYNGEKKIYIFSRIKKNNWFFGIAVNRSEYNKPLNLLFTGFGAAFIISVFIGLAIMYRLMRTMIAPVKSLTDVVSRFSEGDMSARSAITSNDETGTLARAFDRMAETIQKYSLSLEKMVEERTRQLKEKNDLIMESISYARRLQKAMLPDLQQGLGFGPEKCFVIWRPRDTVGGDLFWCKNIGNKKMLAVADCTGHGVPGALMGMALNSIIDSAARETGLDKPSKMVETINKRLNQSLMRNSENTAIHDGADIAVLLIDTENERMVFSGAGLSMFAIIDGRVEEFKGSRCGIGYSFGRELRFKDIEIPYMKGSGYFFTTDGFTDQNIEVGKGGIGKKGFIRILENMSAMNISDQMKYFEKETDSKLDRVPQRDDITIIGFEL